VASSGGANWPTAGQSASGPARHRATEAGGRYADEAAAGCSSRLSSATSAQGLADKGPNDCVAQVYADYLPGDLLPIASDPFGNMIALAVSGSNLGRVYFCNHEGEPERFVSIEKFRCRQVAKSLEKFLTSFVPQ
jgi:hypothetical protein